MDNETGIKRKIGVRFSKIVVIQSLKSNDMKTGSLLHEDLETMEKWHARGLKLDFHNVGCRAELTSLLSAIEQEVRTEEEVPVLHFEMHGSRHGLALVSGEVITWDELKTHLIQINILTRNNLLITLAACYGAYLSQVLLPTDRTPCWGLVGPKEEILPCDLLKSYLEFYREIFETGNGSNALKRLNDAINPKKQTYSLTQCEFFFKLVYSRYLKDNFAPRALKVRAGELYLRTKAAGKNVKHPKEIKKYLLQSREEFFEKHLEHFFMMDLYPENRGRFNVTYADVLKFRLPRSI